MFVVKDNCVQAHRWGSSVSEPVCGLQGSVWPAGNSYWPTLLCPVANDQWQHKIHVSPLAAPVAFPALLDSFLPQHSQFKHQNLSSFLFRILQQPTHHHFTLNSDRSNFTSEIPLPEGQAGNRRRTFRPVNFLSLLFVTQFYILIFLQLNMFRAESNGVLCVKVGHVSFW